MKNVKTAVSIEKSLFEQVDGLAREMKLSRSRLFALALEEFVRRRQNERLLEQIDQTCPDEPDANEAARLRSMQRHHRKLVEGEW